MNKSMKKIIILLSIILTALSCCKSNSNTTYTVRDNSTIATQASNLECNYALDIYIYEYNGNNSIKTNVITNCPPLQVYQFTADNRANRLKITGILTLIDKATGASTVDTLYIPAVIYLKHGDNVTIALTDAGAEIIN